MMLVDGFRIDIVTREEHSHPSSVTKLPIESGGDTSDHNREENDIVSIDGIVSDSPIGDVEALRTLDGDGVKPSDEARAKFLELRAAGRPITIVTKFGVYESMAVVDFTPRATAEEVGGLFFTMKFEKQRITKVERVAVASPGLDDTHNLGNRPTKPIKLESNARTLTSGEFWIDNDCEVYIRGTPGIDVQDGPGSEQRGLRRYSVWRKSSRYNAKTKKYDLTKGPLRDGFNGTDEQIKAHVIGLTSQQRRDLIPPTIKPAMTKGGITKKAVDESAANNATRNDRLRVDDAGNVGTYSPSDPKWKTTKPFVRKP